MLKAYTPINEHRCSKVAKEFLREARKFSKFSVKSIHVPSSIFSDLLESMSPNCKAYYSDEIPFEGKVLVRK